jgi:hypothetical protein
MPITPSTLRELEKKQPIVNDLLRGWGDAELGVEFHEEETEDWKLGWRLWHEEHGQKRSSHAFH